MARKKSGGFNKFLNIIGLVDDVEPRDSYGDEYASQNYGRASTYIPPRQRNNQSRANQDRRSLPAQAGRSRTGATRTYGDDRYDDYRNNRRTPLNNYEEINDDFDNAARRSRFEEEPPRRIEPVPATLPAVRPTRNQRQRTLMSTVHTLGDCCEVIDNLIAGYTIVLTMNELDGMIFQRALDTLSGAVFALHATIHKAAERTYLLAPNGVEVNDAYDIDHRF